MKIKLCRPNEIPNGKAKSFNIDEGEVSVVNLNGKFFAVSNICPHQRARLVNGTGGIIEGENIICPMHGWTYNVKTGKPVYGEGKLKTYKIEISNGEIWLIKQPR